MDPMQLCPPEVWKLIFEQVTDSQDWLNLYRASTSSFEVLFRDERPAALFSQVYPLVVEYLNEDINDILRLRLVSRQVKETVDKAEAGDPLDEERSSEIAGKYWFNETELISEFLERFATHPGNPIIGSTVHFHLDGDGVWTEGGTAEFRTLMVRFMSRFGSHIKQMHLWDENMANETNLDKFLVTLESCLQLVPDLEALEVEYTFTDGVDYSLDDQWLAHHHQPPIISGLKSFSYMVHSVHNSKTDECSSVVVDLQNLIVRMVCNPGTLKKAEVIGAPSELRMKSFPNLEKARLHLYGTPEDRSSIAATSWPALSSLGLYTMDSFTSLEYVTSCVEHFKDTLTSLWVSRWEPSDQDYLARPINLPRLKCLEVFQPDLPFSLLANLSNLEELRVVNTQQTFDNEEQALEYLDGMEGKMLEFDVWRTLAKLRKIKFSTWYRSDSGLEKRSHRTYSRENCETGIIDH